MILENNSVGKVTNGIQETGETLLHLKTEAEFRKYFEEIGKNKLTFATAYGLHIKDDDLRPKYLIIIVDTRNVEDVKIVNTVIYAPCNLYNNLKPFLDEYEIKITSNVTDALRNREVVDYQQDEVSDELTIKFNDNKIAIIKLATIDCEKIIDAVLSNAEGKEKEINEKKYIKVLKSEADRLLSDYIKVNKIDCSLKEIYNIMKKRELIYGNNGKERVEYREKSDKENDTFIAFRSC
ncbi:MAG: hypothetical protein NC452_11230 [Eubacterium sp.]|nr:hypothetical protein [Eubacterium sp.]